MYEFLKAISEVRGWPFDYGRSDFHNLFNEPEQKNTVHLFLDPVKVSEEENDSGVTEDITFTGSFMIAYSSDIDEESYEDRYLKYMKPLMKDGEKYVKESLRCTYEPSFDMWEYTEVINALDYNFDGILVKYKVSVNVEYFDALNVVYLRDPQGKIVRDPQGKPIRLPH